MQNFASWYQFARRRSASPAASEIALARPVTVSDRVATCRERLDGGPQCIRANHERVVCGDDPVLAVSLHDELHLVAARREDDVRDDAAHTLTAPGREAASRRQRPPAFPVERDLLAHEDERRGNGDTSVLDLAGEQWPIAMRPVPAADVEAEYPPKRVVQKDVDDDAEADVGITHQPAHDRACAERSTHRPEDFLRPGGRN